jgi:hypothetical protein
LDQRGICTTAERRTPKISERKKQHGEFVRFGPPVKKGGCEGGLSSLSPVVVVPLLLEAPHSFAKVRRGKN